jgi:hypothetical protein
MGNNLKSETICENRAADKAQRKALKRARKAKERRERKSRAASHGR